MTNIKKETQKKVYFSEKDNFINNLYKSIALSNNLLKIYENKLALDLKKFILNSQLQKNKNNLFKQLLNLDLSIDADFINCLTLSTLYSDFKIVCADLSNFYSYYIIHRKFTNSKLSKQLSFLNHTYFETSECVFFPTLNIILDKEEFETLACPIEIFNINSEQLKKSEFYQAFNKILNSNISLNLKTIKTLKQNLKIIFKKISTCIDFFLVEKFEQYLSILEESIVNSNSINYPTVSYIQEFLLLPNLL